MFPGRRSSLPAATDLLYSFEKAQSLRMVLTIVLILAIILTLLTYMLDYKLTCYSLAGLVGVCLVAILVNRNERYRLSAALLSLGLLAIIQYNAYVGEGIHDIVVIALPGVLAASGLLYGPRAIPAFTLLTIGSLAAMALLPNMHPIYGQEFEDLLIGTTLLAGTGLLVHFTVGRLERYNAQIKQSKMEVLASYDATLEGWAKALELRNKETEGHSRNVTTLTLQLARALGITNEDALEHLRRGSLLHDIGKIAIPDSILLKPGPLTDEEWAIMKQHTEHARSFINHVPQLKRAVDVVMYHHEHWDGSGYPSGLSGEEIPLGARIFSVADNWDALRSDRPYRKAWPHNKVVEYIQENAGKLFDPKVVRALISITG